MVKKEISVGNYQSPFPLSDMLLGKLSDLENWRRKGREGIGGLLTSYIKQINTLEDKTLRI